MAVVSRLSNAGRLPVGLTAAAVVVTGFSVAVAVLACWPDSRLRSVVRDRELLDILPDLPVIRRLGRRVFS